LAREADGRETRRRISGRPAPFSIDFGIQAGQRGRPATTPFTVVDSKNPPHGSARLGGISRIEDLIDGRCGQAFFFVVTPGRGPIKKRDRCGRWRRTLGSRRGLPMPCRAPGHGEAERNISAGAHRGDDRPLGNFTLLATKKQKRRLRPANTLERVLQGAKFLAQRKRFFTEGKARVFNTDDQRFRSPASGRVFKRPAPSRMIGGLPGFGRRCELIGGRPVSHCGRSPPQCAYGPGNGPSGSRRNDGIAEETRKCKRLAAPNDKGSDCGTAAGAITGHGTSISSSLNKSQRQAGPHSTSSWGDIPWRTTVCRSRFAREPMAGRQATDRGPNAGIREGKKEEGKYKKFLAGSGLQSRSTKRGRRRRRRPG